MLGSVVRGAELACEADPCESWLVAWVAIVREGADPEVLEVHRLGDDIVAGVLDLDRDGRLELEIHDVFGDHVTLVRTETTTTSPWRAPAPPRSPAPGR